MNRQHSPDRSHRGFTLLEILTAAVLSAAILTLFMALTVKFVGIFDRLRGGDTRLEDIAARALDMIEDDLSAAHIDSKFYQYECLAYWDHPTVAQSVLGIVEDSGLGSELPDVFQPEKSGILLFFSKTLNRIGVQKGDVQALAYRLAYMDPIAHQDDDSSFKTFNLYRISNSPAKTLDMINQRDLATKWKGGGTNSGSAPVGSERTYLINDLEPEFLVVRNVVDFRVTFLCSCIVPEDNNEERYFSLPPLGESLAAPRTSQFRIGGNHATNETKYYTHLPSIVPDDLRVYPSAAEVSLTILSDVGLKLLWAAREGRLDNIKSLNQLVEEHGRTYTRTVKIQPQI